MPPALALTPSLALTSALRGALRWLAGLCPSARRGAALAALPLPPGRPLAPGLLCTTRSRTPAPRAALPLPLPPGLPLPLPLRAALP